MKKETKLKIKIAEAATGRYIENRRFTIQSLAKELEITPKQIFDLFPNRSSILRYFYESRIVIYREQLSSIKEYSTFTLSEKLNNIFLSLLDQFSEHREFVLLTYREMAGSPVRSSTFEKLFKEAIREIFQSDEQIATSAKILQNRFLYHAIYLQFHGLILFWKNDESHLYENSMALVDKWCALQEEIFYSKIVDKGFDLGKFLYYNSPINFTTSCALTAKRSEA